MSFDNDPGFLQFKKSLEITRHLQSEVKWWLGEGVPAHSIALALRGAARDIDPSGELKQPSWGEQWRSSEGYAKAQDYIAQRRAKLRVSEETRSELDADRS